MKNLALTDKHMGESEPPRSEVNPRFRSDVAPRPTNSESLDDAMERVLRSGTDETYCFLNEGQVKANVEFFKDNFLPGDPHGALLYAMKANSHPRIMQLMVEAGIDGFDCASRHENEQVLALEGMEAGNVHFNNPVKKSSHLVNAFSHGVSYYTAQSKSGVEKILVEQTRSQLKDLIVAVRLKTFNKDAKINLSSKFGCSPTKAVSLIKRIRSAGAKAGLAMHTGSQNLNPYSYAQGIELMKQVAEKVGGVSSANLGGGYPVPYGPTDHFDIWEYLRQVNETMEEAKAVIFGKYAEEARILMELGRVLVANAVDLAMPVLEMDENCEDGKKEVYVGDGTYHSFSDRWIHDWPYYYHVYTGDGRKPSKTMARYKLWGQTCDSRDELGEHNLPADLREGDFVCVKNAGAYMDSQRSGFNGFIDGPIYVSYNV